MFVWEKTLLTVQPSKSSGCPFSEAKRKAAKVVKFVAMWLNLYPHTVIAITQTFLIS